MCRFVLMKEKLLGIILLIAVAAGVVSCERPLNPVEEGTLSFNGDTVKFDSIFRTFLSPSERLIAINNQSRAIQVSRIWLEEGENTVFEMIIDGLQTLDTTDIVIAGNDSIHIFVNLRSELKDDYVEEYINFQVGEEIQQVLIRGKVIDGYFLRARLRQNGDSLGIEGFFFTKDTVLTPDKPIIMDGPIFIPEGVTVSVLPGTQIHFTPYKFGFQDSTGIPYYALFSTLIVNGTLIAEGISGDPVVFQGARFDSLYLENPAQWRGLWFTSSSSDNILSHCVVKNGIFGVRIDSSSVNFNPKVTIRYSEIKNMGAYGLWVQNFAPVDEFSPPGLHMENSIVNTCKERTVLVTGGGRNDFFNCTFANFNLVRFSRRTPQILVNNYLITENSGLIYPTYTRFTNCLIYGSEEDEFVIDTIEGYPFDELILDHCIVNLSEDNEPLITPHLSNSQVNADPLFNDYFVRDYRLKEGSPAINAGTNVLLYSDDFRNAGDSLRYDGFDIGAYEYYPLEE